MNKKYQFKFPITSLLGLVCLGLTVFILLVSIPKKDNNNIILEKKVEKIVYQEKGLYINFYEDETNYVFYELNGVKYDIFKQIKLKDSVIIEVEENYKNFDYAIIQKLTYQDSVLFDFTEYYYNRNMNITNIFAPTALTIIITYLLIIIFSIKKTEKIKVNEKSNFLIKNEKGALELGIIVAVFGTIAFLMFLIQYLYKIIDYAFFSFSYFFVLFAILGGLLVYMCIREKFQLKDEIYSYRYMFKNRNIKLEDIKKVEIYLDSLLAFVRVTFYNKKGDKIISFLDNGMVFDKGYFIQSLKHYDIRYSYKTKYIEVLK